MINKPTIERTNSGLLKVPIETKVASSLTTNPELIRAMIVINKPIPAVIPNFRFAGIWLTRASLNLKKEILLAYYTVQHRIMAFLSSLILMSLQIQFRLI